MCFPWINYCSVEEEFACFNSVDKRKGQNQIALDLEFKLNQKERLIKKVSCFFFKFQARITN